LSKQDQQDIEILREKHPEGTKERNILDYSRGEQLEEELPTMLVNVFKLLMVISFIMGLAMAFGWFHALTH
jgi:hypothetical protein